MLLRNVLERNHDEGHMWQLVDILLNLKWIWFYSCLKSFVSLFHNINTIKDVVWLSECEPGLWPNVTSSNFALFVCSFYYHYSLLLSSLSLLLKFIGQEIVLVIMTMLSVHLVAFCLQRCKHNTLKNVLMHL